MKRPGIVISAWLFGVSSFATAQTNISGEITTQTWTKADQPYHVTDTVTVLSRNTLTIEPGVDVVFDADVPFVVSGRIHAVGSVTDSIRFVRGSAVRWRGLRLISTLGEINTLHYVRFSNGYTEAVNSTFAENYGGGLSIGRFYRPIRQPVLRADLSHVVVSSNISLGSGGGIAILNASAALSNCTVKDNESTTEGGGIYIARSSVNLADCAIDGNIAGDSVATGGGVRITDKSVVGFEQCTITNNMATEAGGGLSADFSFPHLTMSGCTISGNTSRNAGGVVIGSFIGSAVLRNCTISGNTAVDSGLDPTGGIAGGIHALSGPTTVANCTISGNSASSKGGGVFAATIYTDYNTTGGQITFANCTIAGNTVDGVGGGVAVGFDALLAITEVALTNCTITENSATDDGGGVYGHVDGAIPSLTGTIVWDNILGSNIVFPAANVLITYSDVGGGWIGKGNIKSDPRFANAANGDFTLRSGSPCVDVGDPYAPGDLDGSRSDMGHTGALGTNREIPRIEVVDKLVIDFERPKPLFVRNSGWTDLHLNGLFTPEGFTTSEVFPITIAPGGSVALSISYEGRGVLGGHAILSHNDSYGPSVVELVGREGAKVAGNLSGLLAAGPYIIIGPVTVPPGKTLTIEPGTQLIFDADVRLLVQGALHAVGTPTDSILFVRGLSPEWGGVHFFGWDSSTVSYARISGGHADHFQRALVSGRWLYSEDFQYGGGIQVVRARLGISHSVIEGNRARLEGGGLAARDNARVSAYDCVFWDNRSHYGGAVATLHGARVDLTNCFINNNKASFGGGVSTNHDDYWYTGTPGVTNLNNTEIIGNWASNGGGGVRSLGNTTLTNCTISDNSTEVRGGGVLAFDDTRLINCTISDNSTDGWGGGVRVMRESSAVTLTNCTMTGNTADSAGLRLFPATTLTNCILWGDMPSGLDDSSKGATVTYSDIEGGWVGMGNIDADPLFADTLSDDYSLLIGSPGINAGDPEFKDNDGSIADMGAHDGLTLTSPPAVPDSAMVVVIPASLELGQNTPNPFNPGTAIQVGIPVASEVRLTIYNVSGQKVSTLVDDYLRAGEHIVAWDGRDRSGRAVASGVYIYRLSTDDQTLTRRMVLVR